MTDGDLPGVVPEEESVAALCELKTPPLSLTPQLLAMITNLPSLAPPSGGVSLSTPSYITGKGSHGLKSL